MNRPKECSECGLALARFQVFSAYDAGGGPGQVHPLVARYPAPMAHPCDGCLTKFLLADMSYPGSNSSYYVRAVER